MELIVRDVDAELQRRIERYARMKDWDMASVLPLALRTGMQVLELREQRNLASGEDAVLADAIKALEQVPNDPGFGMIGREIPLPLDWSEQAAERASGTSQAE